VPLGVVVGRLSISITHTSSVADGIVPAGLYLRNVSDGSPRSRATWAIGRPLSNTSRAPRSSSSGGYFLGRPMRTAAFLSAGTEPRIKVSVKPSLAHGVLTAAKLIGSHRPTGGPGRPPSTTA
jgi:hypothetical protein